MQSDAVLRRASEHTSPDVVTPSDARWTFYSFLELSYISKDFKMTLQIYRAQSCEKKTMLVFNRLWKKHLEWIYLFRILFDPEWAFDSEVIQIEQNIIESSRFIL